MSDDSRANPFIDNEKGKPGKQQPDAGDAAVAVGKREQSDLSFLNIVLPNEKKPEEKPAAAVRVSETSEAAKDKGQEKQAEKPAGAKAESVDTQAIYKAREAVTQAQQLEQALIANCFVQQADGSFKARDDKELVDDGQGGKIAVEVLRANLVTRMSERYETAISIADSAMKDPESVVGSIVSTKSNLDSTNSRIAQSRAELAKDGINPAVGDYLDSRLIERYMAEHKDLSAGQKEKLRDLSKDLDKKLSLEAKYGELIVTQELPESIRRIYAKMLSNAGLAGAANRFVAEADKVAQEFKTSSGRSEFVKRQTEQVRQRLDDSLDTSVQAKYLQPENDPLKLVQSAEKKVSGEKQDLDGARKDLEKAREMAKTGFPDLDKDLKAATERHTKAEKDWAEIQKKGSATPYELMQQHEKLLLAQRELEVLESAKLAKSIVDIKYASFLLHKDKDQDSESNRKYARDILMGVTFDSHGRILTMPPRDANGQIDKSHPLAGIAEEFQVSFDKATNGSQDNRVTQKSFDKAMGEHHKIARRLEFANKAGSELDELLKQGVISQEERQIFGQKLSDKELGQLNAQARHSAVTAAEFAAKMNRTAAHENQEQIKLQLKKQIDSELAKPESQRDQGKIKMLQAVMKPPHELNAEEKEILSGVIECMKTPQQKPDQAIVAKTEGMLKDKSAMYDVITSFSLLQQFESQKQALNQARLAILDMDARAGKAENNPLVAEIENDRFGQSIIATLNAVPGQDGRSAWGDIKEASREKGTGEKIWNWSKGFFKELSIAVVSWGAGALAALGVGALTSWTGPGAIAAGGAAGFAAGAGAGHLMRKYVWGEKDKKLFSVSTVLDGLSGATGGIAGTTYAVARGAGESAVRNVIAQQATKGITLGADQTWAVFKAAGMADKLRIAAGGTPFLAAFSSATASSVAYRYPSEALTGNYDNAGDWLKGATMKVAWDTPTNLLGARFVSGMAGKLDPVSVSLRGLSRPYYTAGISQASANFLFNDGMARVMGTPRPQPVASRFNEGFFDQVQSLHNYFEAEPENKEKK